MHDLLCRSTRIYVYAGLFLLSLLTMYVRARRVSMHGPVCKLKGYLAIHLHISSRGFSIDSAFQRFHQRQQEQHSIIPRHVSRLSRNFILRGTTTLRLTLCHLFTLLVACMHGCHFCRQTYSFRSLARSMHFAVFGV